MKQILIRPLVTEKMSAITDKQGKYGFIVNRDANKIEIKQAVEKSYGVTVLKVNTINVDGKRKFRYTATASLKDVHSLTRRPSLSCRLVKQLIFTPTFNILTRNGY